MKLALQAKRKLGFVTRYCKNENYTKELHEHRETCNAIVLSWIINTVSKDLVSSIVYASNAHTHYVWEDLRERFDKVSRVRIFQLHREIATISQGTDSILVYFTKLKELWDEFDAMTPSPDCGCDKAKDYVDYLQQQRLLQFLSGLNEV